MTDTFRALRLHKTDAGQEARFEDLGLGDLMEGDVTVRVSHSTVNFKDGLALTGKSPVVRVWPLIPGIDFAGAVEASSHPDLRAWARRITAAMPRKPGSRATGWSSSRKPSPTPGPWPSAPPAIPPCSACSRLSGTGSHRTKARWWSPARPAASAASLSRCSASWGSGSSPRPAANRARATTSRRWAPARS